MIDWWRWFGWLGWIFSPVTMLEIRELERQTRACRQRIIDKIERLQEEYRTDHPGGF